MSGQSITVNPNPFSKRTLMSFNLATNDSVSLNVTNTLGSVVATFYANSALLAGNYNDSLIMDGFPDGVYFVLFNLKHGGSKAVKIIKSTGTDIQRNADELTINTFPNPVKNILNIESPQTDILKVYLCNSLGQSVYSSMEVRFKHEIDVSYFPVGIYFLKITYRNKQKKFKIVKD
jgi:hypothetical protein